MASITIRTELSVSGKVRISVHGYTKEKKEMLKNLGYRWGETPDSLAVLKMPEENVRCWYKYVEESDVEPDLLRLDFLKGEIKNTEDAYTRLHVLFSDAKYSIKEDYKPNWNGCVYGKEGDYHIFRSQKKIEITDEEASELRKENPGRDILSKYNLKRKEIGNEN